MFRTRAIALLLALLAALPVEARILKGRLFMGRDMQIFLQEDESLVTDLLRSISLVKSEVPVVNLSAAALRPDQLAIGTDRKIYAPTPGGGWVQVGQADDVSALELAEGVTLRLDRDVLGAFAGETNERLVVRFGEDRPRCGKPPIASFTDWLAALDRQGADLPSSKAPPASYVFLFNAIAESLPADGGASPRASDNFRAFKAWIETGSFTTKAPLEQLLKRIKKDTQVKLVGGKGYGEPTSDGGRLLSAYEALEAALRQR